MRFLKWVRPRVLIIALFVPGLAAASLRDLVGSWFSQAALSNGVTFAKVLIQPNGEFFHEVHGRGDIQHINGQRYKIVAYRKGQGSPFACEVVVDKFKNGDIQISVLNNLHLGTECDWGRMSPGADEAPKAKSQPRPEETLSGRR